MKIAFCSSCNNYELYGESQSSIAGHVKIKTVPKPKYCGKCGAEMRYACPSCGASRETMANKFCTECGKPYK